MAQYTAGEMKKLHYVPEVTYGVTPPVGDVPTLTWGANCESLKGKVATHKQFHILEASRSFGSTTSETWDAGFTVKAVAQLASGAYDWRKLWAVYGLGSTSGLAEHLGSFTAQTGKVVGANQKYNWYNGCKITKLQIGAEKVGMPVGFEADVLARWFAKATTKAMTGLQALTVGADPTNISTNVLCWNGALQYNLGGAGLTTWHPKSWKLIVDNHIERHYGNLTGADTNKYPVTWALNEGKRDIDFEVVVPHEDETWIDAKLASTAMTAVTIPLDTFTLTLSNGEILLEEDDLPEYKQDLMEETIKVKFKTLSIA